MSYIDRNLLPDENIIFRTKKHLIIFLAPVLLSVFSIYATSYMQTNIVLAKVAWTPWLVSLIFWGYYGLEYITSDFVITNKRIIMREGFFNRHTTELRVATVSQVNVDQNLLGQLLDYGTVSLNAFGAFDFYPLIAHPIIFQKNVNEGLDKLTK